MSEHAFMRALGLREENLTSTCEGADVIIAVGVLPSRDNSALTCELKTSVEKGSKLVYLFTMEDPEITPKSTFFSRYEAGSEEGVLALLAKSFLANTALPQTYAEYFDALDDGYVSSESNIGEEEIEEIDALCHGAKRIVLLLGEELRFHLRAAQIASFANVMARFAGMHVMVVGATSSCEELSECDLDEVESIASFDGVIVYECPSVKAEEERLLIGSTQFQMAAKVQEGDVVSVRFEDVEYKRIFKKDELLKGVIGLLPMAQREPRYPYHVAKIVK